MSQGFRLHPLNRDFVWGETPREAARRLTPEQLEAFDRDGFIRLESVFTPHEVADVIAAIDPVEEAQDRYVREKRGGRLHLTDSEAITFTVHIVTKSEVLRGFAGHQVLKDVCHDLIGGDVRLYWDQSVYKKTGKVQEFPWHQDNGYAFIEPQQYLTIWIPLVDVDEDNGCPWIAPGLHRLGTLEHWTTDIGRKCLETVEGAVPVPAKAGDAIVFSSLAPHRTGPNLKTGSVRKAYILQYAPEGASTRAPDGSIALQTDPARQFPILQNGR